MGIVSDDSGVEEGAIPPGEGSLRQLAHTVATRAGMSFAGKIVGLGLQFITQLVLALVLGPARFGMYSLGYGLSQLFMLVAKAGLGTGAVRFAAVHRERSDTARLKGVILSAVVMPLAFGTILALPLVLWAGPLANDVFGTPTLAPVIRLFAFAVPLSASMQAVAQVTTAFGVTGYMVTSIYLVHPGINLLLVGLCFWIGFGLVGVSAAWVAATAAGLLAALVFVRRLYRRHAHPGISAVFEPGPLLGFSLPLLPGEFLWVAMLWMDVLMLGLFLDSAQVGIYRAASQTAILLTVVPFAVDSIFGPMIARLHEQGDTPRIRELFQVSARWSLTASLPIFATLVVGGDSVLRMYGAEFPSGWLPLVILVTGQLVNCGTAGVGLLLVMTGHQYHKVVGDLAVAAGNVALNLYLIPRFGLLGAAVATSLSVSGTNLIRIIQVKVLLDMHPFTFGFLKPLLAGGGAMTAALLVRGLLEGGHFLASIAGIGAAALVAFVLLLWVLGLDELDLHLMRGESVG